MSSKILNALLAAGLMAAPLDAAFAQGVTAQSPPSTTSTNQEPQPANSLPAGAATGSVGPSVSTGPDDNSGVQAPSSVTGGSARHRQRLSHTSHQTRRSGGGYSSGSKLQNPANAGSGTNGGTNH